jgi:hypothetical protein
MIMSKTELEAVVEAQAQIRSALDALNVKIGNDLKVVLEGALEPLKEIVERHADIEYRPPNANIAVNILTQVQSTLQQIAVEPAGPLLPTPASALAARFKPAASE